MSRKKRIYRTYRFNCFAELKDGVYWLLLGGWNRVVWAYC